MAETHRISTDQELPVCTASEYEYYRYHGMFMGTYSRDLFSPYLPASDSYLEIEFGSRSELDRAIEDLITNQQIYRMDPSIKELYYSSSDNGKILFLELCR